MNRCAYALCQCPALPNASYCGDTCEWLDGGLLGKATVQSAVPLKEPERVTLGCACGHSPCADAQAGAGSSLIH